MIKSIEFKHDHFCFNKGERIEFAPLTLLVGDQGAGKSMLMGACTIHADSILHVDAPPSTRFLAFNSEKDAARSQGSNPNDPSQYNAAIFERLCSHGEALLPYLTSLTEIEGTPVVFLDEPETALSIRSQYKVIEVIKELLDRGCQLVIATHSVLLMQEFPEALYSVEHRKWMTYTNFLRSQRKPDKHITKREGKRIKKEHCKLGHDCVCAAECGRYKRTCEHNVNYKPSRRKRK